MIRDIVKLALQQTMLALGILCVAYAVHAQTMFLFWIGVIAIETAALWMLLTTLQEGKKR